jgi:uncharacterized protein YbaR (Trm112 family)
VGIGGTQPGGGVVKVSVELLQVLRCPVDGQRLRLPLAGEPGELALVTEDGVRGYPWEDGFPCLVRERAIDLRPGGAGGGARGRE